VGVDYCYAPRRYQYLGRAYGAAAGRVTYIGTPISMACCSAACRATRAPLCVKLGTEAVAAAVGDILRCMHFNKVKEQNSEEWNDSRQSSRVSCLQVLVRSPASGYAATLTADLLPFAQ
jgi:hypothetical protein